MISEYLPPPLLQNTAQVHLAFEDHRGNIHSGQ
jgi:hypothetical protein